MQGEDSTVDILMLSGSVYALSLSIGYSLPCAICSVTAPQQDHTSKDLGLASAMEALLDIRLKQEFSLAGDSERLSACVRALEDEQRKIEAFRRELPLCMQLISDVVQVMREQQSHSSSSTLLLENGCKSGKAEERSTNLRGEVELDLAEKRPEKECDPQASKISPTAALRPQAKHAVPGNFGIGSAFSPFIRAAGDGAVAGTTTTTAPVCNSTEPNSSTCTTSTTTTNSNNSSSSNNQRKSRRCWSPDLHRRFVAALQHLGGPHVATPKQIREVMKVDGLTNDEVKSHLQKYRLHTRRPIGSGTQQGQLVVLGWVSPPATFFTPDLYSPAADKREGEATAAQTDRAGATSSSEGESGLVS